MGIHPATLEDDELLKHCEVRRQRRSGPGGQHRNKVETGIVLRHVPSGVEAAAFERRSQQSNMRQAIRRLRIKLAIEVRSESSTASELWTSRCINGRLSISEDHVDFPALLSEAIDSLSQHDWNLSETAQHLGCSSSQLARLLKLESEAFSLFNRERSKRGLHKLK